MRVSTAWFAIAIAISEVHGKPLPKSGVLTLGDENIGWGFAFDCETLEAVVFWNGFSGGSINRDGGLLPAGELANEQTLLAWLKTFPNVASVLDEMGEP